MELVQHTRIGTQCHWCNTPVLVRNASITESPLARARQDRQKPSVTIVHTFFLSKCGTGGPAVQTRRTTLISYATLKA